VRLSFALQLGIIVDVTLTFMEFVMLCNLKIDELKGLQGWLVVLSKQTCIATCISDQHRDNMAMVCGGNGVWRRWCVVTMACGDDGMWR
jgi:hypothetical protein